MKKYGKRTLIVLLFIVILSLGVVLFNEIFSSKAKAQESSLEDIRIELIMSEEEDAVIGILSFNKDNEPIAIDIPDIYIYGLIQVSQ